MLTVNYGILWQYSSGRLFRSPQCERSQDVRGCGERLSAEEFLGGVQLLSRFGGDLVLVPHARSNNSNADGRSNVAGAEFEGICRR